MNEEATRAWIQRADDDLEAGKVLIESHRPINH